MPRGWAGRGDAGRGLLEDFGRWRWPAALALAAALAWMALQEGRGGPGAAPEPRPGPPEWASRWSDEVASVSEWLDILAEVAADIEATRDDPCSSPLHFLWDPARGWMAGTRGRYLPLPPETVDPDWLAALEGLRARGRESVMEVDLYRIDGRCG